MIRRSLIFASLMFSLVVGAILSGCVEIPSEGHTPPDYKSSVRVMYLDPAVSGPASIRVAPGPNFDTWSSSVFESGSFGTTTAYSTVDAGDKFLFVESGSPAVPFDPDTSVQQLTVDQRGTLVVLPRPDVAEDRFMFLGEGRTIDPIGVSGSARVRFLNAVTQSATDTIDVTVDIIQLPDSSVAVSALEFRATSAYILVPVDSSVSFYMARTGSMDPLSDETVSVTGQSNTDYTAVASGASDNASFVRIQNQ